MKHQIPFKTIVLLLITVLLLSSCGTKRDIVYFQNYDSMSEQGVMDFRTRIMPNDNLFITVTASKPEAVEVFNLAQFTRGSVSTAALDIFGYLVDNKGNINLPLVGEVKVAGLTKSEAINLLQDKINYYLTEKPIVNIRILNFKISVLGEVNRPGTYTITDEKISIIQALSLAGDLTIYGERNSVQLKRIEKGELRTHIIDLTSNDLFFSPYYYLQQDDLLYVSPNKTKAGSSTYNQNLPLFVSLISVTITAVALFLRYN